MVPAGLPSQSTGTDGPALQHILCWAASIGLPARLSLCPRITRHLEAKASYTPPTALDSRFCPDCPARKRAHTCICLSTPSPPGQEVGGVPRLFVHLGAERRVPPAAIFRDENREPMGQEVPSARSRSGGSLTEGSPQGQPRKNKKPGHSTRLAYGRNGLSATPS